MVDLGLDIWFDFCLVCVVFCNYISVVDLVLVDIGMLEVGFEVEVDGYDVVCIDMVSDSGVVVLCLELLIFVIGLGWIVMLIVMMLGNWFLIVMMWDYWWYFYERMIKDFGFVYVCVLICFLDVVFDNLFLMIGKESEIFLVLEELV